MNWLPIAGGAGGLIVVVAAVAAMLRRRRPDRIDSPEAAAAAAEGALPGFSTAGAVVGADGAAALAVDGAGRVAVMKRQGRGIAVREVAWTSVRAGTEGMVVEAGSSFGQVVVAGVDALDVRRLAPHLQRG